MKKYLYIIIVYFCSLNFAFANQIDCPSNIENLNLPTTPEELSEQAEMSGVISSGGDEPLAEPLKSTKLSDCEYVSTLKQNSYLKLFTCPSSTSKKSVNLFIVYCYDVNETNASNCSFVNHAFIDSIYLN